MNYDLSTQPTIKYFDKKNSLDEKIKIILDISTTQSGNYCKTLLNFDPNDSRRLQNYTRSKYITEQGELFRHPIRFIQFGGDCDDQTIFLLAHNKFLVDKFTEILIMKNEGFFHITQTRGDKIFDCLPYEIPLNTEIIRRVSI